MSGPSGSVDNSSQFRIQSSPVQVSSVGFNTLKKLPTNSSNASSLATSSSKSRTLTRFFTRNKGGLPLSSEPADSLQIEKVSKSDKDHPPPKSLSLFNVSRWQNKKLNLSNKSNKKPELTIQTGGHANLKIPKKIISSENAIDFNKSSSPVSRNPLYRSPVSSFAENQQKFNQDEMGYGPTHYGMNPNRTTVTLSSQSSNSFITDVNTAVIFNFTDPDFTGSSDDQVLDLHRRYMTSADYYMQKLHKSPNIDGSPISSNGNSMLLKDEKFRRGSISNGKVDDRIFSQLFDMLRSMFTPSKSTKLQTGYHSSLMTSSVEQIAKFVKDNIVPANSGQDIETQNDTEVDISRSQKDRGRSNTIATIVTTGTIGTTGTTGTAGSSSTQSLGHLVEDDLIEIQSKELSSKLYSFFFRCCQTLARDLEPSQRSTSVMEPNFSGWKLVCDAWDHFNTKCRFPMLHIFFHLEMYYEVEKSKRPGDAEQGKVIECEKELLSAFSETFIIPLLRSRSSDLDKLHQISGAIGGSADFLEAEKVFFAEDPLEVKNVLTACFGIILSRSKREKSSSDDQQSSDILFTEFVQRFDAYTRA